MLVGSSFTSIKVPTKIEIGECVRCTKPSNLAWILFVTLKNTAAKRRNNKQNGSAWGEEGHNRDATFETSDKRIMCENTPQMEAVWFPTRNEDVKGILQIAALQRVNSVFHIQMCWDCFCPSWSSNNPLMGQRAVIIARQSEDDKKGCNLKGNDSHQRQRLFQFPVY